MSWVQRKGDALGDALAQGSLRDLACRAVALDDPFGGREQSQAVRERHVAADGRWLEIRKGRMTKSSIDPERFGRTQDGALFAHEHLDAGQTFRGAVTFAASDRELAEMAFKALAAGAAFIGRSRHAQYGEVQIDPVATDREWPLTGTLVGSDWIVVHALSDLALRDEGSGTPTLTPQADAFGLPSRFVWRPERSALRTRHYSPFNATRRRPDLLRSVLCRGSIIVFAADNAPLDAAEATAVVSRTVRGIGAFGHDGLGRVAVNPVHVGNTPDPASVLRGYVPKSAPVHAAPTPDDALFRFLGHRARLIRAEDDASLLAETWQRELEQQYKGAKEEVGRPVGPSSSQWGAIREAASRAGGNLDLLRKATVGEDGFCCRGVSREAWNAYVFFSEGGRLKRRSFADLVRKWTSPGPNSPSPEAMARALAILAGLASHGVV